MVNEKFGRQLEGIDLEIQHAGHRVPDRELPALPGRQVQRVLDANTYLLITRVARPTPRHGGSFRLQALAAAARARFLLVSFTTDWRFRPGAAG